MPNIKIDVPNEELLTINRAAIGAALRLVARTIKSDVIALLRSKSGSPSAPGSSPSSETGTLSRSIVTRIQNNKKSVSVSITAAVKYAASLEGGANGPGKRHMDPRPYLSTVIERRKDWIESTISKAITLNYKGK